MGRPQKVEHVGCMFTAGNGWAFFEPRRDLHVYVERSALAALREALPPTRSPSSSSIRVQAYVESLRAEFLRRNLLPRLRVKK